MITGLRRDLIADRWVPFVYSIDIVAVNLVGADLRAQVRQYNDESGAPLIDMPLVASAANGVRFLGVNIVGPRIVSSIQLQIDQPTMAALPAASDAGCDVDLVWDLIVTPANDLPGRWLFGTFTVRAGATHNG